MGYLICEKCGGYYELQPGEKAEDFSDDCECGGKLIYSETLDVIGEGNNDVYLEGSDVGVEDVESVYSEGSEEDDKEGVVQLDTEVSTDEYYGDELTIKEQSKTLEDYKNTLIDKSKLKDLKFATEVREILATKGYFIVKGNDNTRSIKILEDGIETDDGQFIQFDDIINIEGIEDDVNKPKITSEKSKIGGLISTGYQMFVPRKMTLKITFHKGEIELRDVKGSDAKRCVSFVNRRLNKINNS